MTLADDGASVLLRRSEYRTFLALEPQVDASLARRLVVEAVGTGLLIIFGPGSVVAALAVGDGNLDYAALGIIGLSFGLVVALLV